MAEVGGIENPAGRDQAVATSGTKTAQTSGGYIFHVGEPGGVCAKRHHVLVGDGVIAVVPVRGEFPVYRLPADGMTHLNRFARFEKILDPRSPLVDDPILPEDDPVPTTFRMPVKTFRLGGLVPHRLTGLPAPRLNLFVVGGDQDVLVLLVGDPRYHHRCFLAPNFVAGCRIECPQRSLLTRFGYHPTPSDIVVECLDVAIEVVDPIVSDCHRRTARLGCMIPDDLSGFSVEGDQSGRYAPLMFGGVENGCDQQIVPNPNATPPGRRLGESEFRQRFSRSRINSQAALRVGQIDAPLDRTEVVAGMVVAIIKVSASSRAGALFNRFFPENFSGIDIDGRQRGVALEEHSAINHRKARPPEVAIEEKSRIGGGTTEPEDPQGELDALVLGHQRVGGIAIFVRPVRCAFQRPLAAKQARSGTPLQLGLWEFFGTCKEGGLLGLARGKDRGAAIRVQHLVKTLERLALLERF